VLRAALRTHLHADLRDVLLLCCMQPVKGRGQSQHLFATDAVTGHFLPTVTFGLFSEEGKLGRKLLFLAITHSVSWGQHDRPCVRGAHSFVRLQRRSMGDRYALRPRRAGGRRAGWPGLAE